MATAMQKDVKRIRSLIDGIASHCETVAEQYAKAVEKHGEPFTAALVQSGLERSWLNCLEDVGRGNCAPGVLFLSPDKRNVLRCLDVKTQNAALKDGINKRPIDQVSIDDLRASFGGKKHEGMKKRAPVAVRSHIRTRPQPEKSRPVVTRAGLAIVEARVYSWLEVAALIEQNADTIPDDIKERISNAVSLAIY